MTSNDKIHNIFQTGVILGRITQLSVDRGIVISSSNMGLADFLALLSEEIQKLPFSKPLIKKIVDEIKNLSTNLSGYQRESRIEPDDARIMIGFVSRWTDMLYDELLNSDAAQKTPVPGEMEKINPKKKTSKRKPVSPPIPSNPEKSEVTKTPVNLDPQNPESPITTPKDVKEKDPTTL